MNFSLRCSVLSVAAVALLSGCGPTTTASPEAASAWANSNTDNSVPKPSESPALSAQEQVALDQAVEVVMGYRQTITDLYSGAATRVADLDKYLANPQLELEKDAVRNGLASGRTSEPKGVRLVLASAELLSADLRGSDSQVIVRACIDSTASTGISGTGIRTGGVRESLDYLVRIDKEVAPRSRVTRVTRQKKSESRSC